MLRNRSKPSPLKTVTLDALTIEDETSFRHVGLFADLRSVLSTAKYEFLVPVDGAIMPWNRALFLNLTYWDEREPRDVLCDAEIPADVLMHVAWHHLGSRFLAPSREADLLSEAIASAFDLYLVGRVLGHAPDSSFLATQVPQMADVAETAGLDEESFEELLEDVAADPDQAFEDLRALLYRATTELMVVDDAETAFEVLASMEGHRFAPLLHHYELSTWVTKARFRGGATTPGKPDPSRDAKRIHDALVGAKSSIEWLETEWVRRAERAYQSPTKPSDERASSGQKQLR